MRMRWTNYPKAPVKWEMGSERSGPVLRAIDECLKQVLSLTIEQGRQRFHITANPLSLAQAATMAAEAFFFEGQDECLLPLGAGGGPSLRVVRRRGPRVACSFVNAKIDDPRPVLVRLVDLLELTQGLVTTWRESVMESIPADLTAGQELFLLSTLDVEGLDDVLFYARLWEGGALSTPLPDGRPLGRRGFANRFMDLVGEDFPEDLSTFEVWDDNTVAKGLKRAAGTPVPNSFRRWLALAEDGGGDSAFLCLKGAELMAARWTAGRLVFFEDEFAPSYWPKLWRAEWPLRRLKFVWEEGPKFKDGLIASFGVFEQGVTRSSRD